MELVAYQSGELAVLLNDGRESRYSRVSSNQLILCARMNDWNRFTALWKKKTENSRWDAIENVLISLDSKVQWRVKEIFARQTTVDEENSADLSTVVKRVALTHAPS